MSNIQTIAPVGINANLAPFAFQHYAKDFYEAYKQHKEGARFSPARLFLLCRGIELAAKSLHLAQGRNHDQIFRLNHDIDAACDEPILATHGIAISPFERAEIKKANEYYKRKGFEYFLYKHPSIPIERSGPALALNGWPDLPDESVLEALLIKLLAVKLWVEPSQETPTK